MARAYDPEQIPSQRKNGRGVAGVQPFDGRPYGTSGVSHDLPVRTLQPDGGGPPPEGEDHQGRQRTDPGQKRHGDRHQPNRVYHIRDP